MFLPHIGKNSYTVNLRHHDVEYDRIVASLGNQIQGLLSVKSRIHIESFMLKQDSHRMIQILRILCK